ncbi:MAG: hypothetical protein GY820_46195 [Gammaproteobacteria bacterium]|nr:hypothetical protein [Gammaproteobacteria bacterium]
MRAIFAKNAKNREIGQIMGTFDFLKNRSTDLAEIWCEDSEDMPASNARKISNTVCFLS